MQHIGFLNILTQREHWRSVRLLSMVTITVLLLVGIVTIPRMAGAMSQATAPANSTLSVEPVAGAPGTVFSFAAGGFEQGETVTFWANDPTTNVYSSEEFAVSADESGTAYWTWTAPEGAMEGNWSMVADGMGSQVQQVIFFEISSQGMADDPAEAVEQPAEEQPAEEQPAEEQPAEEQPAQDEPGTEAYADPQSGTPGTVFTFYAAGFQEDERVSYWINDPAMNVHSEPGYSVNADDSTATWSWTAPVDAANGTWSMVAEGIESQVQHVILFEITGGAAPAPEAPMPEAPAPEAPAPEEPAPEAPMPVEPGTGGAMVEPESGTPGTEFSFAAAGFIPREAVKFWANDPATNVYAPQDDSVNADQDGLATWEWMAPRSAMNGQWSMVAEGVESQVQYVILFTIEAGTPGPGGQALLTANPEAGPPGTLFTFYADGFNPEEGINFWVNDPETNVLHQSGYSTTADQNGQAIWTWRAPAFAMLGQWSMVVEGVQSQNQQVILFQITTEEVAPTPPVEDSELPANAPGLTVQPMVGTVGTEMTFSAAGFDDDEPVSYWANDPTGLVLGDNDYVVDSDDGTAEWTWTVPEDARPGVWSMVASGARSGVEYIIYFGVE